MINVSFYYGKGNFCSGFLIEGHAGFCVHGYDIVCAGVSSAAQMCCNGITDVLGVDVQICCEDAVLSLRTSSRNVSVQAFLEALRLHISLLQDRYKENITLKVVEE